MLRATGVVLSIALADSINPSTIGPALFLAGGRDSGRRLLLFTGGVFIVSTGVGEAVLLGPGQALLGRHVSFHTQQLVETLAGAGLILAAAAFWLLRRRWGEGTGLRRLVATRTAFFAGAAIMTVELPTAFPYFAALAAVSSSGGTLAGQMMLIVGFNVVFVLPLIAVLWLDHLGKDALVTRARRSLERRAQTVVPILLLLLGLALIFAGTT
jgi:cytochrome c biogenesis protein CcdA